jgi:hypothetical protein
VFFCIFLGKLKDLFTEHERMSVMSFLKVALDDLVPFYSLNHREFLFYRIPDPDCRSIASKLDVSMFSQISDSIVHYSGKTNIYKIDFANNSCSCRWYLAYAVCAHIVAACRKYDRELNGCKAQSNYVYRSKRGAKPKPNHASQYLLSVPVGNKRALEVDVESEEQTTKKQKTCSSVVGGGNVVGGDVAGGCVIKKRRGRPKLSEVEKIQRASTKKKVGRPKKATPALNFDDSDD